MIIEHIMNWKVLIFSIILYAQVETSLSVDISNHTLLDTEEVLLSRSNNHQNNLRVRDLQASGGGGGERKFILNVQNLSYRQPFSRFFVLVHNSQATPLYTFGEPSSKGLARMAEYGQPGGLENYYKNIRSTGVKLATRYNGVTYGGKTSQIEVIVSNEYPLVSIAAMCENTNDCFVALNGVRVVNGAVFESPGLDAGSEVNNESCDSVPGPVCAGRGRRLDRSGNGEGYVHVHRKVRVSVVSSYEFVCSI